MLKIHFTNYENAQLSLMGLINTFLETLLEPLFLEKFIMIIDPFSPAV